MEGLLNEMDNPNEPESDFINEKKSPIDVKKGIDGIGGETWLFYEMMQNFDEMTLTKNLMNMKVGMERNDFHLVREQAHSLKGKQKLSVRIKVQAHIFKQLKFVFFLKKFNMFWKIMKIIKYLIFTHFW